MTHLLKLSILIILFFLLAAPQCSTTCNDNADCTTAFCLRAPGDCDGKGRCSEKPEACDADYTPVCGCDNQTYSNECDAAAAGVSIATEGECTSGGACVSNYDCFDTEYCAKNTGDCEGTGTCETIPDVCIEIYSPVCGCDGEDYPNDCHAFQSAVNVLAPDLCENTLCPEEDCGPQLGIPNYPCVDKTTGGPTGRCLKTDNDTCGWEIRDCEVYIQL